MFKETNDTLAGIIQDPNYYHTTQSVMRYEAHMSHKKNLFRCAFLGSHPVLLYFG